jgi:hypothetical protein
MSALIPFLVLDQTCGQVQVWANQQLTSAGFRVVQTFDLQVARLAHPDCTCPNHGTEDCNCQMVVLLVYPKKGAPATLVIHGQEDKSWLSLSVPEGRRFNQRFETAILRTLRPKFPNMIPRADVVYETQSTV